MTLEEAAHQLANLKKEVNAWPKRSMFRMRRVKLYHSESSRFLI